MDQMPDNADRSHGAFSGSQHSAGKYVARWDQRAPTPAGASHRVYTPSLRERLLAKPWKTMVEGNVILRNWNKEQQSPEADEPPHKHRRRGYNLTQQSRQRQAPTPSTTNENIHRIAASFSTLAEAAEKKAVATVRPAAVNTLLASLL